MTYADFVSITTAAAGTEVTGTIKVPSGARIIELSVAGLDTDGIPAVVRVDYPQISTPQRYLTGIVETGAVAAGLANHDCKIPVDLKLPAGISEVTIGLTSLAAAGTWYVGVKWV